VDEAPDGYQANVADGIVRLRYREGRSEPNFIQPGEVVGISIDLWSTAWTIEKGHRIGLHISSSNFPRFDRNLNTADPIAEGEIFRTAKNTVYHDAARPSALEIHVLRKVENR